MARSTTKAGVFDGKLGLSVTVGPTDTIKLVGPFMPPRRSMSDMQVEVFGSYDDGLNLQREAILRYRVAAAAADMIQGQRGERLSERYAVEASRQERDLYAICETVTGGENVVVNHGVRMEDV